MRFSLCDYLWILGFDWSKQLVENGGEGETVNKPRQLIDCINISIFRLDKNLAKLHHLRNTRKFSIGKIARVTGHSTFFIKKLLKQNNLYFPKEGHGIAPYGWDLKNGKLIHNMDEQWIINLIKRFYAEGYRRTKIANLLNQQGVSPKYGKTWWPHSVQRIINREILDKKNWRKKMRPP